MRVLAALCAVPLVACACPGQAEGSGRVKPGPPATADLAALDPSGGPRWLETLEGRAAAPASTPTASLPAVQALPDTDVVVSLEVSECAGIAGIQVEVTFDPTIVQCTGVAKGALLTPSWALPDPNIDNDNGNLLFLAYDAMVEPLPAGQGEMFAISFHVRADAAPGAVSPLHFQDLLVSDEWGEPIAMAAEDGEVAVIQTWFEDDDPQIIYHGDWRQYDHPAASAGHLAFSNQTGAWADFTFYGTGLRWSVATGPMAGKANIYLDGRRVATVDLYRPGLGLEVLAAEGLPAAERTISIAVTGQKNPASTGYIVDIDAFEVVP